MYLVLNDVTVAAAVAVYLVLMTSLLLSTVPGADDITVVATRMIPSADDIIADAACMYLALMTSLLSYAPGAGDIIVTVVYLVLMTSLLLSKEPGANESLLWCTWC
jgi:hypothetical protein